VAGVRRLVREGRIRRRDSVVAILTGHLLKDPEAVVAYHRRPGGRRNPPLEIDARVSAVERVLERLLRGRETS
jgi:threonine synthase